MKARARRSSAPAIAGQWRQPTNDEDYLSEPPEDEYLDDLDDLPPPEDEEPELEPEDEDELSLPSFGSVDDDLFYFGEIDDDPELDEAYGDYLDELSDPEDYLPTYDDIEGDEDLYFYRYDEDDVPPPEDEDDLPPPEDDFGVASHVPFNSNKRYPKDFAVDPKQFLLPDNIQLPVILPSQRAEYEAKKLRNSGQFGGIQGLLQASQASATSAASSADQSEAPLPSPARTAPVRRGSINKRDQMKAALEAAHDTSHTAVPLSSHPIFGKYFKMLKAGVPKELVTLKMSQDGFDSKIIDLNPCDPLPAEYEAALQQQVQQQEVQAQANKVPVSEHPVYAKYFKMLKMGVPRSGVEQKLIADELDPRIIALEPMTLVPLKERRMSQLSTALNMTLTQVGMESTQSQPQHQKTKKKKKLFVEGIGADQLSSESFWAQHHDSEDDEDNNNDDTSGDGKKKKNGSIVLDKEEFEKLFVEENTSPKKIFGNVNKGQKTDKAESLVKVPAAASKYVQLLSHKRAQNVSIILARIKLSNETMLDNFRRLSAEGFASSDQLRALMEALPLPEEIPLLQQYTGDFEALAVPEKYMKTMMQLPDVKQRIAILIYKQQFLSRWHEIKHRLGVLESACDQIKASKHLQKVLRTILKVVNKLQEEDDEDTAAGKPLKSTSRTHKGITVESLVALTTAKAFDRKTTVLQYVVNLIHRHDRDVLTYPKDLTYLHEVALKLSPDIVHTDLIALVQELRGHIQVLRTLHEEVYHGTDEDVAHTLTDFEHKLLPLIQDLDRRELVLQGKYQNILQFFGEKPQLSWPEFMGALWTFTDAFMKATTQIERLHQQEHRKQLQQQRGTKSKVLATV